MNKTNPIEEVIETCPFCGLDKQSISRDNNIFNGQSYSDRYSEKIAEQNHGFNIRCEGCGNQTCWWHLEEEAIKAWNTRNTVKEDG